MTATAGPTSPPRTPALTAGEIAVLAGGTVTGDSARVVRGVAPLIRAAPDQLSFLSDKRYAGLLAESRAGVVLISPDFASVDGSDSVRIVVAKPLDALIKILPRLYPAPPRPVGVDPTAVIGAGVVLGAGVAIQAFAVIGDGARLGDGAWIGPHCVVGEGVAIGAETRLVDHVTCYPGTQVGERVILHAGTRIGSDGFGYVQADGKHRKIPHVGRCIIEDDVEIGANTCVDRGSIDDTVIGAGAKIDNLVHIAHNVRIGRLCLIMAQVGIAGSARVGDGTIIAGQAGINGHIEIGAGATVAGQAGVFGDIPDGEFWSGYPARPHKQALRAQAAAMKLADRFKEIERLLAKEERLRDKTE